MYKSFSMELAGRTLTIFYIFTEGSETTALYTKDHARPKMILSLIRPHILCIQQRLRDTPSRKYQVFAKYGKNKRVEMTSPP